MTSKNDPKKEQLWRLIKAQPFLSPQELANLCEIPRSVAEDLIASLIREQRILGRAYMLPSRPKILCIGGANLDRKLHLLAPVQMESSNPVTQSESYGGVARNIAQNLAALGVHSQLLCVVGDDAPGRMLLADAAAKGIDTEPSLICAALTGSYTAILDEQGDLHLGLSQMAIMDTLIPEWLASRQHYWCEANLVIADLNLSSHCLEYLRQQSVLGKIKKLVLVAVSRRKMQNLPTQLDGIHLLILNADELAEITGQKITQVEEIEYASKQMQELGLQQVIVTQGAAGVWYSDQYSELIHLSAENTHVVDATGAGDAFSAAVCWSLSEMPNDVGVACERGLKLAALTIRHPQSVAPTLEIQQLFGV